MLNGDHSLFSFFCSAAFFSDFCCSALGSFPSLTLIMACKLNLWYSLNSVRTLKAAAD